MQIHRYIISILPKKLMENRTIKLWFVLDYVYP